ncbi:MAG: chlorosome envelope protein B [Candidatus Chlorobium antarcticum]|jgi:chlorosome envelope protein B|nr:chlorosome envelope protein B [Candidatus Chlorobium antarcticum]
MENAPGNKANDISESVKSLSETVGQVGQQQIEIMTSVMKSGIEMAEPITKSVVDLAGSMMQSVNQVLQGVSSAIAPKKQV